MHNTLIVTDDVTPFRNSSLTVLNFQEYLAEVPKLNEPKTRVINISRYHAIFERGLLLFAAGSGA